MKIIRYQDASGSIHHASLHPDGRALRLDGELFGDFHVTDEVITPHKLLAPVLPSAIICIGLNYKQHAEESGMPPPTHPVVFMKLPGTVQNPGDPIELPVNPRSDEVDYECELAVVIGRMCRNVPRDRALDYVLGYTAANDVSARDWQMRHGGGQWCRGKMFDTFAPLGPCLVLKDEIPNPNTLRIRTLLNGRTMQDSNTRDMIFDVPALIEFLSGGTTLHPGTVILTGTPQGVGAARKPPVFLQPGDSVTIDIESVGALTNPVVSGH